jgi:hypothetical protein
VATDAYQARERGPREVPGLKPTDVPLELASVLGLAWLLDESITIPGTNKKVGDFRLGVTGYSSRSTALGRMV